MNASRNNTQGYEIQDIFSYHQIQASKVERIRRKERKLLTMHTRRKIIESEVIFLVQRPLGSWPGDIATLRILYSSSSTLVAEGAFILCPHYLEIN